MGGEIDGCQAGASVCTTILCLAAIASVSLARSSGHAWPPEWMKWTCGYKVPSVAPQRR
jgi:hypothetical protein